MADGYIGKVSDEYSKIKKEIFGNCVERKIVDIFRVLINCVKENLMEVPFCFTFSLINCLDVNICFNYSSKKQNQCFGYDVSLSKGLMNVVIDKDYLRFPLVNITNSEVISDEYLVLLLNTFANVGGYPACPNFSEDGHYKG